MMWSEFTVFELYPTLDTATVIAWTSGMTNTTRVTSTKATGSPVILFVFVELLQEAVDIFLG